MTCILFTPPAAFVSGPARPVMLKRLIRTKIGLFCLSWIAALIVAALMATVRWRTDNPDGLRSLLADHDGFILVFWHEHILSMPWLWPRRHPMTALQSPHPDGRMLAHTVNHLGVRTVWGSSNRNALSGLRGLKRVLDRGGITTITPDGPRGPARRAAMGPVALAHLSGKPIVPVAWATDRFWRAPGWDGMRIPKPLSRGVLVVGDPIAPPATGDRSNMEAQLKRLEAAMNDTARTADRLVVAADGRR
jgi:lysophospholipid acyltransferase (LPLAT)-like uncharacterized protein